MKTLTLIVAAIVCLFVKPIAAKAQCGTDPTSGTTTISLSNQIVNSYYPGTDNPTIGQTSLTVGARDNRGSSSTLAAGDLVMIIQMQGADINTSNTSSYGSGISGAGSGMLSTNLYAGAYEYNTVNRVTGSTIRFSFPFANNYYTRNFSTSNSIRRYQVIRVPRHYNLTIGAGASITAPAWNGSTGGVAVLDATNVATINGTVNVSAKGFRGGGGKQLTGAGNNNSSSTSSTVALNNTDYRYYSAAGRSSNTAGGSMGEGIAGTPRYTLSNGSVTTQTNSEEGYIDGSVGRGAPANAGGGATDGIPVGNGNNQYNSGGGGGANGGNGGHGGSGWHGGSGNVNTYRSGGMGGSPFPNLYAQKFIMGGGGGAGTANNCDNNNEYQVSGGVGGGIIVIFAKSYAGNGSLLADGGAGPGMNGTPTSNTDGGGGGGAGGTIIAITKAAGAVGLHQVTVSAVGGTGGNSANYYDHGPGGGGGGGFIFASGALAAAHVNGGANGKTRTGSTTGALTNDYGATPGAAGIAFTTMGSMMLVNSNATSSPCGILPVTLVSLNGVVQPNGVLLSWQIADALNLLDFEIEYSNNGFDFLYAGKTVYTEGKNNYNFYHDHNLPPIIYYRLKMVDIDGSYTYSKIITLRVQHSGEKMLTYPNPARQSVTVQVKAEETTEAGIRIINSMGHPVMQKVTLLQKGDNVMPLDVHTNPAGLYIIEIRIKKGSTLREKLQIVKE